MAINVIKKDGLEFVEVSNEHLKVTLCNLGASIYAIQYDNDYMTLTPVEMDTWKKIGTYHGKTIGRVCNRLPGNTIDVDGKKYTIENNEGPNTLHGGKNGISDKIFDYEITENGKTVAVEYTYLSKDGESGFPGNLTIRTRYVINKETNEMRVDFYGNTDKKTMLSITNHAYFMMGLDNDEELNLTIKSDRFLDPKPEDLLPLDVIPLKKCLDFYNGKIVGEEINDPYLVNSRTNGYDHYFYFAKPSTDFDQIILTSNKYEMTIRTDFQGTQIYSDNFEDDVKFYQTNKNKRRGIAIEPSESQHDLHYLDVNENYHHFISYKFRKTSYLIGKTNLTMGPRDPDIIYHEGYYYQCFGRTDSICIKKVTSFDELWSAPAYTVFKPTIKGIDKEIWAPELHIINGKCYIYVAIDDGNNYHHRTYVLYNDSADPLVEYKFGGQVFDDTNKWAIDATVFEYNNNLYMCWAGWEGDINDYQNLYIAHMSDPFHIDSKRVLLSKATYDWERIGGFGEKEQPYVNEGPYSLKHDDDLFIVYSASGCWTDHYCLGLLKFMGGDILDAKNWKKFDKPIFTRKENVNGPGHASFITNAPDGRYYFAYHAFNKDYKTGWADTHAVVQEFTFKDGLPFLGEPAYYYVK